MTTADDARDATTWEAWFASQQIDSAGQYAALIRPLPYALDWRENPNAPCPPEHVWARCLCGVLPVHPPRWRGEARRRDGSIKRFGPSRTIGSMCGNCHVELVRVDKLTDPYPTAFADVRVRCWCGTTVRHERKVGADCGWCGLPFVLDTGEPYPALDINGLAVRPPEQGDMPDEVWRAYRRLRRHLHAVASQDASTIT